MPEPGEHAGRADHPNVDLPFELDPSRIVLFVTAVLVVAWTAFLAISAFDVRGLRDSVPAWELLFNDRPVEWLQWVFHSATAVTGAYTAGQLRRSSHDGVASFWGLMAVGSCLLLIEDSGDIRHVFRDGVGNAFGDSLLGTPVYRLADVPYFALLAAIPLYALWRYGRHPWALPGVPRYLGTAVGVYAVVAIANALRHVGDYYERLGARFHDLIAGGELPPPEGWSRELLEFHLIDGPVEESLELIAAGLLFAALLATIRAVNRDQPGAGPHPGPALR